MNLRLEQGQLMGWSLLQTPALARILALLNAEGEEARVVGGAVRDLLLGIAVQDFDISTTALPEVVMARAKAAGIGVIPTGINHGTVTLVLQGQTFEVTSLREDVETDGRHAKVRFGRNFATDARRRDFTINALSLDIGGFIHDDVGGLADLSAGRVIFIGDARQRIREDYLRILRFLRFSARFSAGQLDARGFSAAIQERAGLATLSAERIKAELFKLLLADYGADVIAQATEAGLMGALIGLIPQPIRLKFIVALETALNQPADPLLRLAGLFVVVRENVTSLRERLRLSNAESGALTTAAVVLETFYALKTPPSPQALRKALYVWGRSAACWALALAHKDSGASIADIGWLSAHRFLAKMPIPQRPFMGADLVQRGIAPGRALGEALRRLENAWIEAGFPQKADFNDVLRGGAHNE